MLRDLSFFRVALAMGRGEGGGGVNKADSTLSSTLGMFREEREGIDVLAGYLSH